MRLPSTFVVISLAVACASSTAAPTAPVADPVPMVEDGTTATSTRPATAAADTLAAYERLRALLAADQMNGVADGARALEAAANKAKYTAVASSATKLAATTDLVAARAAFGEVSRGVVTLLASDKALAKGQYVFECPMVKGYRKWVQPNQDMANPYMGKKMLACGGESTWH